MGIFKSLFGSKKPNITMQTIRPQVESSSVAVPNNIKEVVMLIYSENYSVDEKKYPQYLRNKYGIGFPNETISDLVKKGYIRPSTAVETLPHLKGTDLKAIATEFGVKASGKKEELCERLSERVSEEKLSSAFTDRYWKITEAGKAFIENNKFIEFFLEEHPYTFDEISMDIKSYAKLFSGKTKGSVRDVIWGELNRRSIDDYKTAVTKGEFVPYCNLLRFMARFLEEEKNYIEALEIYLRYIHYRVNFAAGLTAIQYYSFLEDFDDAANLFFSNAQIYPFIANDIHNISVECGFDSAMLKNFMLDSFAKEKDIGMLNASTLADFVMCGLNGDGDGQLNICKRALKSSKHKISKRR